MLSAQPGSAVLVRPPPASRRAERPPLSCGARCLFPLGHMICGRKLASFSTQEPDMPAGDTLGEQPSECVFPPPHGHRFPLVELNEPSSCLHLGKYRPRKVHSPNCKWTLRPPHLLSALPDLSQLSRGQSRLPVPEPPPQLSCRLLVPCPHHR